MSEKTRTCAKCEEAEKQGPRVAAIKDIGIALTGRCEVCGVPELGCSEKLCMDYDHISDDFRGYLCKRCNTIISLTGGDSVILDIASVYLKSHEKVSKQQEHQ